MLVLVASAGVRQVIVESDPLALAVELIALAVFWIVTAVVGLLVLVFHRTYDKQLSDDS